MSATFSSHLFILTVILIVSQPCTATQDVDYTELLCIFCHRKLKDSQGYKFFGKCDSVHGFLALDYLKCSVGRCIKWILKMLILLFRKFVKIRDFVLVWLGAGKKINDYLCYVVKIFCVMWCCVWKILNGCKLDNDWARE